MKRQTYSVPKKIVPLHASRLLPEGSRAAILLKPEQVTKVRYSFLVNGTINAVLTGTSGQCRLHVYLRGLVIQ